MTMQEKRGFAARSGQTVKIDDLGGLNFHLGNGYLGPTVVADAADYFLAAHDESVGRWRWPEVAHMVVYPMDESETLDLVKVLDERTLVIAAYDRDDFPTSEVPRLAAHREAARAYFDAHPRRQPKPTVDEIIAALRECARNSASGSHASSSPLLRGAALVTQAADALEDLRRGRR